MGKSLEEIARQLKDCSKKVQLIYAFNGVGKTRLSRAFKELIVPKNESDEETGLSSKKILYYNAFTEDLFYWDNDLHNDIHPKLKIHPNVFTEWVFVEQGQERNVISNFQNYVNNKALTPEFKDDFSEVTFSLRRGNDQDIENIKISKGEESNFIWSVFYSLLEQVVEVLNIPEESDRETDKLNKLEYIFKEHLPNLETKDFYELEIASAGIMRGYISVPCDMYFTIDRKIKRFIESNFKIYDVSNETIEEVLNFLKQFDFKEVANEVLKTLFIYLEDRT